MICILGKLISCLIAWLVFSGKRDVKHDGDELVAIVYDGTYEVLQGLYHDVEQEANSIAQAVP